MDAVLLRFSVVSALVLIGITPVATRADPASPWGVSSSSELSHAPARWANQVAAVGVTSVRGFDDRPQGAGTAELTAAGLSISGILAWTPTPRATFPVNDLEGFRRYVVQQITRYKGVV